MALHEVTGHGCMVYTECMRQSQKFHLSPTMQQLNSSVSTPLGLLFKMCYINATVAHLEPHVTKSTVGLLQSKEQHYIKVINTNHNKHTVLNTNCLFLKSLAYPVHIQMVLMNEAESGDEV